MSLFQRLCVAHLSAYCFHVCLLQQAHIKCVCNCSLLFSLSNIQTLFSWKKNDSKTGERRSIAGLILLYSSGSEEALAGHRTVLLVLPALLSSPSFSTTVKAKVPRPSLRGESEARLRNPSSRRPLVPMSVHPRDFPDQNLILKGDILYQQVLLGVTSRFENVVRLVMANHTRTWCYNITLTPGAITSHPRLVL